MGRTSWKPIYTKYGKCLEFNPDLQSNHQVLGEFLKVPKTFLKKSAEDRRASLSFVVGYNQSDSGPGWFHFLAGLTLFYSESADHSHRIDPLHSVSLPPLQVPMLAIVHEHIKKLGQPYSLCVRENEQFLSTFSNYTIQACQQHCIFMTTHQVCRCSVKYLSPEKLPHGLNPRCGRI